MEIKVLGPGCPNCQKVEEMVKAAVKELGIEQGRKGYRHVRDYEVYDVHSRNCENGKLTYSGKPLPTIEKVKDLLKKES